MEKTTERASIRRACRGTVRVYPLIGGCAVVAELVDVSKGGASLVVDRPFSEDQGVRLVFPGNTGHKSHAGRTIVGHVVHSRHQGDRYSIGVAFGWEAAVKDTPRPISRKAGFAWFGLLGRKEPSPERTYSRKPTLNR